MTNMTAIIPAGEETAEHIEREVSEIISVYSRLFPTQALNFVFYEGKDPVWSAPSVVEGPFTFHPDQTLLHKSGDGRGSPFPGRTYPTASVTGMPSAVYPFRTAIRTWSSAT